MPQSAQARAKDVEAVRPPVAADRRRAFGLLAFLALALIELAWAVAIPLGAAPDETSHVYRAVALWRGNVIPTDPVTANTPGIYWVNIPSVTDDALAASQCSAGQPATSNHCSTHYQAHPKGVSRVGSTSARYLPVYYAVVGWPSLIDPGPLGLRAVRLVSGLTSAALLAGAVSTMLRLRRPALPAIGVAAAITPMATGIATMVNPSAWEISGAVLLWAGLLALASGRTDEKRSALLLKVAAGGSVMLLTRQISVLWLVLIAGIVALATGWGGVRTTLGRLRRDRPAWVVVAVLVACAVAEQLWYSIENDPLAHSVHGGHTLIDNLLRSLSRVPNWTRESYGVLGWLDAPAPIMAMVAWGAVLGILLVIAVIGTRRWPRWSVLLAVVGAPAVSIVIEAGLRNTLGTWWQGRYIMPFSLGIPLLCGTVAAAALRWDRRVALSLARWTIIPLSGFGILTFGAVMRRYGAGVQGSWLPWAWHWQPPGTVFGVGAAYVLGTALLTYLLLREVRLGEPDPQDCGPGAAGPALVLVEGAPLSTLAPPAPTRPEPAVPPHPREAV